MLETMMARIKERVGIYGLGFNPDSFMGLVLPIIFVIIVGGIGWFLVRWLI